MKFILKNLSQFKNVSSNKLEKKDKSLIVKKKFPSVSLKKSVIKLFFEIFKYGKKETNISVRKKKFLFLVTQ